MKLQHLLEVKAGRFKSPMIGKKVVLRTKTDVFDKHDDLMGKTGTVKDAERVHTFSQMHPFKIEYKIELDDGKTVYVRREDVRKA